MTDDEVIETLRHASVQLSPVQLAERLGQLAPSGLSDATLVTFFKRAFPDIPLSILREAGAWNRVSSGTLTDEEFNAVLAPWLRPPDALNAADKQRLFDALEKSLWTWRDGALYAPNGTMWLDGESPWNGDLLSLRERMVARVQRIQRNLRSPEHDEDLDASLNDVVGLVEALDTLLKSA